MGELTKEQLAKLSNTALGFYKAMGLSGKKTTQNGEVLDLYRVIGIKPEFDEDGQRRLTPYEILGVPPQFRDGVNETPIVFAIKNRVQKIGKYTGEELNFIYSTHICSNSAKYGSTVFLHESNYPFNGSLASVTIGADIKWFVIDGSL